MRIFGICLGVVLLATSVSKIDAAEDPEQVVPLPPGETLLGDISLSRLFWQSYGKEPVAMHVPFSGGADPLSGATYAHLGKIMDHQAVMLHSPWRVPAGKIWIEYSLALPKITPIRLSFGIAMRPEAVGPGKGDGATFSCYLIDAGEEIELMRRHHDKAEWIDYNLDLSKYAGKNVVLRLQVEPGPKNDTSFDYALIGDAKWIVGDVQSDPRQAMRPMIASRAYQATEKCSLAPLSNTAQQGVAPSNLLPCKNRLELSDATWRFTYEGDDCRIVYSYTPTSGTLDDFTVQVDDGRVFQPAVGGGASVILGKDNPSHEVPARGGKSVQVTHDNDTLHLLWEYDIEGQPLRIDWTYQILGKALVVSARCDDPKILRFSLGSVGGMAICKAFLVPYLPGGIRYLPTQGVFACRYLDWTVSHASQCPQGDATYEAKTDGTRNAMVESGYIAVSPDIHEVLPNIPHPVSPYLDLLGPRIMLDIWSHHRGTYQGDAENLRALKDNGVDHVAIISHVWQRYGYDVKLPDHLPANPTFGGDAGMIEFGKAANECGYVWSLHENYIDLYTDAPSFDATAEVLKADGTPSKAWFNAGTKMQSYGLKCNRALDFAKENSPEIHRRFGTNAGYLDVHTCVPPWHQLDHQADQPMAAQALAKVKYDTELFQFMRDTHKGPLFGEGGNHFYWAGRCDGVESQVNGGEDHSPFLDFDLLKIHPQMVNHGMGYYERWFRKGYQHRLGVDAGSMEQIDKYRAQELAYGHAGFIGASQTANVWWVAREHHLMHPVQRLYGTVKPVEIRYEIDGQMVTASAALIGGDTSRQRIRYDSGLTVWVNCRNEPWLVEGQTLPQWGFLAIGPETKVSTSLVKDKIADYAECPEYVFADARTHFNAPYLHARTDIEPRLASFKYLGDNRIQVTYEWIVNDTVDDDYHCYVHGCQPPQFGEKIEFQQDHNPPKPTSQWKPGDRIVDGPYEIHVPGKFSRYQLVTGMYLPNKERVNLKSSHGFRPRVPLADLVVETKDGKIVNIATETVATNPADPATTEADFAAHRNPQGTWIEFGNLATDGAVKINREKDRLVLFPLPREKAFRVSLNLKSLASSADPAKVQVHALAIGDAKDLGPAKFQWENDRLVIPMGDPGVGRYEVSWK